MKNLIILLSVTVALTLCAKRADFHIKPITLDIIKEYKKTFPAFKQSQRSQLKALHYCPRFIVKIALRAQGLQEVDPDEAYIFLNRSLDDERQLDQAIAQIETVPETVTFLKNLFELF